MTDQTKPESALALRLSRRALLASAALALGCARSDEPQATVDPASLEPIYPRPELFVTPDSLRERLDEPGLRLLDLSALPDYRDGHIPDARHVWWQDLIEVNNPVYGMLVGAEGRQEVVRPAGIESNSTVVCYDRSGGVHASRLIWVLRYMGFQRASLLVGGLQGWRATGGELTTAAPAGGESDGIDDARDETVNAHAADIAERLDEPGLVILDTRNAGERDETWRGQLRRGQLPGSRWLPRDRFLVDGPVHAIVDPDTLGRRLLEAGVDLAATTEIIVYGLHSTLASLPWLALTALGGPHIRLYDGSWAEWGANPALPLDDLPAD